MTFAKSTPAWVADPNPNYHPTVYRKGIWAFQLHPAVLVGGVGTWLIAVALACRLMPSTVFSGEPWLVGLLATPLVLGGVIAYVETLRWVRVLAFKVLGKPGGHVGVLESFTLLGMLLFLAALK